MDWNTLIDKQEALARIPPCLRASAEQLTLNAGQTLFRIGQRADNVYFLVSGEMRLLRHDRNGGEIVVQRTRGGFFAEASLEAGDFRCDALAGEASTVLRFPARVFRDVLDKEADFRNFWITLLSREVRKLRAQCERLSLKTAAERILHYIESEASGGKLQLKQSRKAWAADLGLTHEALYRALKRLETQGTLRLNGKEISIGC